MKKLQQNIPLDQIDYGDRYRQDFGNLEEFAEEIRSVGLIHPITVADKTKITPTKDFPLEEIEKLFTDPEKPYLLLAGGRRFTTFVEHEISDTIPAYVHPRLLNSYEIRRIELMENMSRKELTWPEHSLMTDEIHRLEQKIKGKSVTSAEGGHGLKDTAEMLGMSKSGVKNEIDLAQAIKHLPELATIKNKSEALKVVREMKKSNKAQTRAKRVQDTIDSKGMDGRKEEIINSFVVGDFFEHAEKNIPERTFDLIEIDPPYAIDLGNVKKSSKHTTLNYNEVAAKEYEAFLKRAFLYARKLIKPGGWLVCWYAISPWHDTVVRLLLETGFKTNGLPALWIKGSGQTNRPKHYFGSCYEPFLYARASESSALNKAGSANYLVYPKLSPEEKMHPTHKPIELLEDVILRFIPDGKILVPFAGSGVTLRAAANLGIPAVGYDLSQDYKNKHDAYVGSHEGEKFEK